MKKEALSTKAILKKRKRRRVLLLLVLFAFWYGIHHMPVLRVNVSSPLKVSMCTYNYISFAGPYASNYPCYFRLKSPYPPQRTIDEYLSPMMQRNGFDFSYHTAANNKSLLQEHDASWWLRKHFRSPVKEGRAAEYSAQPSRLIVYVWPRQNGSEVEVLQYVDGP